MFTPPVDKEGKSKARNAVEQVYPHHLNHINLLKSEIGTNVPYKSDDVGPLSNNIKSPVFFSNVYGPENTHAFNLMN